MMSLSKTLVNEFAYAQQRLLLLFLTIPMRKSMFEGAEGSISVDIKAKRVLNNMVLITLTLISNIQTELVISISFNLD